MQIADAFIMTVGGLDETGNRSAVVELTSLNPFTNPIQPCYEDLNLFPRAVADAAGGPIGKFTFKFKSLEMVGR